MLILNDKSIGYKILTFVAFIFYSQWSCVKPDDNFITTTTLYAELDLSAGLTPFKGHYFAFETQNSLKELLDELGYDINEVKIQGQSALLLAEQNQNWGFLQEAQILENSSSSSQVFFASDGQIVSNTSRAILLPFDLVLNDYFKDLDKNNFVLKLTTYQTNTQSFRVRVEIQLNILANNS